MLKGLSSYLIEDCEKKELIDDLLAPKYMLASPEYSHRLRQRYVFMEDESISDFSADYEVELFKYCPKCNKKFGENANFCYDCLCSLKYIDGRVSVHDIKTNPIFTCLGHDDYSSFDEIFTGSNFDKINDFKFSTIDFSHITKNIKRTALKNMDDLIKTNELKLSDLTTDEKILLFAKSFVDVEFKSYGQELGHFEFNKITVDERLLASLYSTTLIHELSHFILKEIIAEILSRLLDAGKNSYIDAIAVYILSYSPFTQLIDEYCAHSVEGRFTIYGYQDYSSFLNILKSLDGQMPSDEVEITKSIANTFASHIKDILESFIDDDVRRDLKKEFRRGHLGKPNYEMLLLENCNNLTDEGFLKAIWLVVSEGFDAASSDITKLVSYEKSF